MELLAGGLIARCALTAAVFLVGVGHTSGRLAVSHAGVLCSPFLVSAGTKTLTPPAGGPAAVQRAEDIASMCQCLDRVCSLAAPRFRAGVRGGGSASAEAG
jgi:hypothetical protein